MNFKSLTFLLFVLSVAVNTLTVEGCTRKDSFDDMTNQEAEEYLACLHEVRSAAIEMSVVTETPKVEHQVTTTLTNEVKQLQTEMTNENAQLKKDQATLKNATGKQVHVAQEQVKDDQVKVQTFNQELKDVKVEQGEEKKIEETKNKADQSKLIVKAEAEQKKLETQEVNQAKVQQKEDKKVASTKTTTTTTTTTGTTNGNQAAHANAQNNTTKTTVTKTESHANQATQAPVNNSTTKTTVTKTESHANQAPVTHTSTKTETHVNQATQAPVNNSTTKTTVTKTESHANQATQAPVKNTTTKTTVTKTESHANQATQAPVKNTTTKTTVTSTANPKAQVQAQTGTNNTVHTTTTTTTNQQQVNANVTNKNNQQTNVTDESNVQTTGNWRNNVSTNTQRDNLLRVPENGECPKNTVKTFYDVETLENSNYTMDDLAVNHPTINDWLVKYRMYGNETFREAYARDSSLRDELRDDELAKCTPEVKHCKEYDGFSGRCKECKGGWSVKDEGDSCQLSWWVWLLIALGILLLLGLIAFLIWKFCCKKKKAKVPKPPAPVRVKTPEVKQQLIREEPLEVPFYAQSVTRQQPVTTRSYVRGDVQREVVHQEARRVQPVEHHHVVEQPHVHVVEQPHTHVHHVEAPVQTRSHVVRQEPRVVRHDAVRHEPVRVSHRVVDGGHTHSHRIVDGGHTHSHRVVDDHRHVVDHNVKYDH